MDELEESIFNCSRFRVLHFHACQLVSLSALTPPSHAKPPDAKDKSMEISGFLALLERESQS